jgi:hypothetical protein
MDERRDCNGGTHHLTLGTPNERARRPLLYALSEPAPVCAVHPGGR